jgi:hypothetical protein
MATCGWLPAIQEGFSRTGTEGDFSSAASWNPISLFGFGGDFGDDLVDGFLHFFSWFAVALCLRSATTLHPLDFPSTTFFQENENIFMARRAA